MKIVWQFLAKLNMLLYNSTIEFISMHPEELKTYAHAHTHTHTHNGTQMFIAIYY